MVNDKFKENFERIDRFFKNVETTCLSKELSSETKSSKKEKEHKKDWIKRKCLKI